MSTTLFKSLEMIQDPRAKRGIRHQLLPILKFIIWGFASGLVAVEHMVAYSQSPWKTMGKELGFDRPAPPDPTTIRRVIGGIDQVELQAVFQAWVRDLVKGADVAAVDGKSLRNVASETGLAQMTLNVFAHDVKMAMARYPIEEGKGEATTLNQALEGLFESYPGLAILTGDAAYAGRPLCEAIIICGKHYLFQVKKNQQRLRRQMEAWFKEKVAKHPPTYEEKKTWRIAADLGGKRDAHRTSALADPLPGFVPDCLCQA